MQVKTVENNINMKEKISEGYVKLLISKNLKRIRSMQNISQLGLAVNAGITHNFINDIENGKKGISAKTLARLCVALNVEPHQFFLPDSMQNSEIVIYLNDINDSVQKVVKELTEQYLQSSES